MKGHKMPPKTPFAQFNSIATAIIDYLTNAPLKKPDSKFSESGFGGG
jgi:hypothetical protein